MSTSSHAISIVESYYRAFRAADPQAVAAALGEVLHDEIVIESPVVHHKFGGPLRGHHATVSGVVSMAPFLKNLTIESTYVSSDGSGVAALIRLPTPAGEIFQSEHFDVDLATGKIKRLRSYYDPRKLLPPGS